MAKPVFSVQWHITAQCDQRCKHCYLFNSPNAQKEIKGERGINFEILKKIADNFKHSCLLMNATPRISITGGDPLLHRHIWDLLDYLQRQNIKVHILGNPFHITDETAQKLKNLGISKFQMSFDGMRNTHDSLRKKGSFDATNKAIKVLQQSGIKVNIMTTVSKANADEIPQLIEYVVKAGVNTYAFARYCPVQVSEKDMFSAKEYREFLNKIWRVFSKYVDSSTNLVFKDHLWTLLLYEKGLFKPEDSGGVVIAGCGLGIGHLSVLADGTVYACRRFPSPVGKVPEQTFFDIFNGQKIEEYRDYSRLDKCRSCELLYYCRGCRAVAYSYTNHWGGADPQCWKKIKG